jgi:hypothetical protein
LAAKAHPSTPGGAARLWRLATVQSCRKELAAVYREARVHGCIDWQDAARAASILQILARMIEGSTFETRLSALEAAIAEHRGQPPRPNGSSPYRSARP